MADPTYTFRLSQHGLDLDKVGHHAYSWPSACRAATTANITTSTALNAGDSIDGVTLAAGDRVLVKDQSTGSQNGIYIVGPTPARAEDYDLSGQILGSVVIVIDGTANEGTAWRCENTTAITVGSTTISYTAFGTPGGGTPTLEDVLLAGNDTAGNAIQADDPGFSSPNYLDLFATGGNVELYGADLPNGDDGKYVDLHGGAGGGSALGSGLFLDGGKDAGTGGSAYLTGGDAKAGTNADGGDVTLDPGAKDGSGRVGLVILPGLPTSDPGVSGALWNSAGTLKVSP